MRGAFLATTVFAIATIALLGARPLWVDEILQLIETRDTPTPKMLWELPRNSGAVPLGYLAQKASLQITGYGIRRARIPAALFGIATVLMVGLLAIELGVKPAWLAAALFALLPESLRYATEGRVYSEALFFSVAATWLYVRLVKEPSLGRAVAYGIAILLTIYSQPYAGCVAIAHLAWSLWNRDFKAFKMGLIAVAAAGVMFFPWFLWSRAGWAAGIVREGYRFGGSLKAPLMVFREVTGAGYWGAGLLVILCALAVQGRRPMDRTLTLLLLLIAIPIASVFAADATMSYFLASRQFMWILPAASILAASAFERRPRAAVVVAALLAVVCVYQSVKFFTGPRDDMQATASYLTNQVHNGACLDVEPQEYGWLYAFFQPDLDHAQCEANGDPPLVLLALAPGSMPQERKALLADQIAARTSQGYAPAIETQVGGTTLVLFRRGH